MDIIIREMEKHICKTIELVIYGNSVVFFDIVQVLKNKLLDRGIECNISGNINTIHDDVFYILFNSHQNINDLNNNLKYAIFNYEQIGSPYVKYSHYLKKMMNANAIFDYSFYNKTLLEKITKKDVKVIPFDYHPCLTVLDYNKNNQEPFDILFYGTINERRYKYYSILKNKFKINFVVDYNLFGQNLINEWKKYKIVLNLHYYINPSVLELSRLVPLIANHKLVLSERSDDIAADDRFKDMVIFIDENTIVDECNKYINDAILRDEKITKAFAILKNENLQTSDLNNEIELGLLERS